VLGRIEMPGYMKEDVMETFQLKGKQQEITLQSVYMTTDKLSKERHRFKALPEKKGRPVQ